MGGLRKQELALPDGSIHQLCAMDFCDSRACGIGDLRTLEEPALAGGMPVGSDWAARALRCPHVVRPRRCDLARNQHRIEDVP